MKITMTITAEQYDNFINEVADELLNPNQAGGAWFDGSREKFEEWAGDVFAVTIDIVFEKLGIEIIDEDEG